MKRIMLILLGLIWAFSNPSLATSGYEFSDEEKCEIISRLSDQLQHLSLLMIVRLDLMIQDEEDGTEPFAHSARDYHALLGTLEKSAKIRGSLDEEFKGECD